MLKLFSTNRNFRSLLMYSTFSGIGNGIFGMFMIWAIHAEFQNTIYTGLAGFMFAAPAVFSFIVGPSVDRWNKAAILRVCTFIKLCAVSMLLLLPLINAAGVWPYLAIILVFSSTSVFSSPAYTAILPRIVDGEDLITANATMQVTGIFGGLGVGVVLFMLMREGAAFAMVYAVNAAVLFLALVATFFLRKAKTQDSDAKPAKMTLKTYFAELAVGFNTVRRGAMFHILVVPIFFGLFASMVAVNMPMFVQIHTGNASDYIILMAVALAGGMIGSYISRILAPRFEVWKIMVGAAVAMGILRIIFVQVIANDFSRALWIYVAYIGIGGAYNLVRRTLYQKLPPKGLIARVDTLTDSLASIVGAIGALAGGFIGYMLDDINVIFYVQAAASIVLGGFYLVSKHVRQLPKISEVGSGEQNGD